MLKIDKKAQTLTVGPGVTFAEIFDPLFKAGFYIRKRYQTPPASSRWYPLTVG